MPDDALTSVVFETTSTGTDAIVAGPAVNGYRLPPAELDGRLVSFEIEKSTDPTERENSRGIWTAATSTLTRDVVIFSTNGNAPLDLQPATTYIVSFVALPADTAGPSDIPTIQYDSDEDIEIAYHNRIGVVEETEAQARLSNITRRWTAERVGQSAAAAISELTDGRLSAIDDPTDYSITPFEVSAANGHEGTALEVDRRNQVRRLIGANSLVRFSASNLQPGDYGQIVNATGVTLMPSAGAAVTLYGNGVVANGDSFAWVVQTATGTAAEVYVLRAQESVVSYDFGTQVSPGDENVVYSRATHGDAPAFWYDVALSAGRTLTFPIAEGVEGGICLIRCRTTVGVNDLTVRLEDAANPGTYVDLPLPAGHTRILRKEAASPSWWTDFGFFQNGAQVNHAFASQAEMEAGTEPTPRSMSPQRVAQAIAALAPVGGSGGVTGVTEPSVLVNASTLLSDASHATVVSGSNLVQRKVRVLHSTPASSVALTFNTTLTRSVNLLVMDDQVGAVTVQPVSGATWEDGTTTAKNLVVGSGETGSAVLEPLGNNNEYRLLGDVVEDKGVSGDFHVGGNLTVTGTFPAGTPAANSITNAMLRDSAALSIIGRSANSTGDPADIATTAASAAVLRESGSTIGFGTVATAGIADNAVSNAKIRDSGALSVVGRSANSTGDPADIAASAASGAVLRESGSTIGFGTIATVGIADGAVTAAKATFTATDRLLGRSTAGAGNGEEITCTAFGRSLIDDADAAAGRTTLAAASASDVTALQGPVNTTSGTTYTLILGDAYSYRRFTSATAVALTVPTNASVAFATGTVITIRQAAAGAVTIGGAGVTLNAPFGGTLVTAGAGATVSLKKVATDTWDIIGQTTAA